MKTASYFDLATLILLVCGACFMGAAGHGIVAFWMAFSAFQVFRVIDERESK